MLLVHQGGFLLFAFFDVCIRGSIHDVHAEKYYAQCIHDVHTLGEDIQLTLSQKRFDDIMTDSKTKLLHQYGEVMSVLYGACRQLRVRHSDTQQSEEFCVLFNREVDT